MKDYILWLSSGESIYGTMEDSEYGRLESLYLNNQGGRQKFTNKDGVLLLNLNDVVAVGINNPISIKKKEGGFRIDRNA